MKLQSCGEEFHTKNTKEEKSTKEEGKEGKREEGRGRFTYLLEFH
jgi:hypothetical protein